MHSSIERVKGVYRNPCLKPFILTYVSAVSFLSCAKTNLDRKEFNGIRWIFPFNLASLVKENGYWLIIVKGVAMRKELKMLYGTRLYVREDRPKLFIKSLPCCL